MMQQVFVFVAPVLFGCRNAWAAQNSDSKTESMRFRSFAVACGATLALEEMLDHHL